MTIAASRYHRVLPGAVRALSTLPSRASNAPPDRSMIAQYVENMAFFQVRIEEARYQLGWLDERPGG